MALSQDSRASRGIRTLVGLSALCLAAALLFPAMPQPLAYHDFADHRAYFGVANFLDVVSNLAFLLVGAAGLAITLRPRTRFPRVAERIPYAIFFAGMGL